MALHIAGVSDFFMFICSRGLSKSWMCGVLAIAIAGLYPYSEIIITSSTISQGNKLAEKILNEIIKKNSATLLYMYEHEYWVKTQSDDGWKFDNKLNGSSIRVLPALDSSRGQRATVIIAEETRLIKKSILDSVFRPMSHPRQAKYLENPDYGTNPRWLEESKTYYLSSASWKYEWLYREWKKCFINIFANHKVKYGLFAGDIYTSMQNGLKTLGDFQRAKNNSTEIAFRCEDLNQFIGEAEDAFFNYEQFKNAQVLDQAFMPLSSTDIIMGKEINFPAKAEDEMRIIAADFAFTETKANGNESDYTQFVLVSGHWKDRRFERHVDYCETWPANDDDGAVQRLKELYFDYNADYIVNDSRNGGENIVIQFSKPQEHPTRGYYHWENRGFGVAHDMKYHIAAKEKIDYYRERAIDKEYIPCLIPFVGTSQNNTAYWRATKRALDRGMLKLLIAVQDKQTELEDSGKYFKLTSEELAATLAPFGQVDALIQEAVNLQTEIKNDNIRLTPPRNGHRDRIVTLAMAMLIFDMIEAEWQRQEEVGDIDMNNIQLVF